MNNETPPEDNTEVFQEICLKLDALFEENFSDAYLVREQVRALLALSMKHSHLLKIAAQVDDIFADATPGCEETKWRIFEVVKTLGKAITDAQKAKVAPRKSPRRRFKETLPYGQIPPLEEPHLD
jgi:hypothetical protein